MTDRDPPPPAVAGVQDRDDVEVLSEGIKSFNRAALTLLLVGGYLLVTVATTSDEALLVGDRSLTLPLIDKPLNVRDFFWFGPGLLLILHSWVLAEQWRLAVRLQDVPINVGRKLWVPSYLFPGLPSRRLPWDLRKVLAVSFILLAFFPPAVLVLFQYRYLPAGSRAITSWHRVVTVADLFVLWYLFLRTEWARRYGSHPPQGCSLGLGVVSLLISLLLLCGTIAFSPSHQASADGLTPTVRILPWQRLNLRSWEPDRDIGSLARKVFTGAEMSEVNLDGFDLFRANLVQANLREAKLRGARLRLADLRHADLSGADLTGADLREADLRGAILERARLDGAVLSDARLERIRGQGVHLFGADLRRARLTGASLLRADLRLADLAGAWIRGAWMVNAQLDLATLPLDARGADLRGASLRGASGLQLYLVDASMADFGYYNFCGNAGSVPRGSPLDEPTGRILLSDIRGIRFRPPPMKDIDSMLSRLRVALPASTTRRLLTRIARSRTRLATERLRSERHENEPNSARSQLWCNDIGVLTLAVIDPLHPNNSPDPLKSAAVSGREISASEFAKVFAREMTGLACFDRYLADSLLDRARGESSLLDRERRESPPSPEIEKELARALREARAREECDELRAVPEDRWAALTAATP